MLQPVAAAIIGACIALAIVAGLTQIKPGSGDSIIQPEGEPDPGKPGGEGRPS